MYKLNNTESIIRLVDNAYIPKDERNTDYQAYLVWVAEGNAPLPADLPSPHEAILKQIEDLEVSITQRRLREALLTNNYALINSVDAQIAALRAQLV